MVIHELFQVIKQRQADQPVDSYTSQLFKQGMDEIVKKVGEEAVEVILAAKGQGKQRLIEEISDLAYHVLVLMAAGGIDISDVERELECRRRRSAS